MTRDQIYSGVLNKLKVESTNNWNGTLIGVVEKLNGDILAAVENSGGTVMLINPDLITPVVPHCSKCKSILVTRLEGRDISNDTKHVALLCLKCNNIERVS